MGITLKDVAVRAGVSIKTVSNVVHDHPHVATETRERVRRAIEALRYQPNLSARYLRKSRVGVLALAIPDLSNTYFADIGDSVNRAAAAHDYTVFLEHTGGTRPAELLVVQGLRPHLIDGVILSPLALQVEDLRHDQVIHPMVLLGEHLLDAPLDRVAIDNVAASRLATAHLLSLGRRRVAAIGSQEQTGAESTQLRLHGYAEALREAGQAVLPELIIPAPTLHRRDGAAAVRQLLALDEPPDAVFCFNDLLALGAMRALFEAGCRVPEDVAVVGFDDVEEGCFSVPTLTTISPDKEEIGQLAVSLLLARIDGTRTGPPERLAPPFHLAVRESTIGHTAPAGASTRFDYHAAPVAHEA